MLTSLMKYEFKAMARIFLPLFAALFILSCVNRLLINLPLSAPAIIASIISGLLIAGIAVLVFVLILQRFWNNLMTNEGYLMMTLPVSTDSLILSKLFVSAGLSIVSFFVVIASIMIMTSTWISLLDFAQAMRYILSYIHFDSPLIFILILQTITLVVMGLLCGILMLYACMSLSMLVNRRRILFAFGAFIVLSTIIQTLTVFFSYVIGAIGIFEHLDLMFENLSYFGMSQAVILTTLLLNTVGCAVYYFITRYMLSRRLNLH